MDEIQKIQTANLIEALRQVQTYLFLAFSASLSALALAFISAKDDERVPVPFLFVTLPRAFAHLVLWLITLVGGVMAGSSAKSAYLIARELRSVPGLLKAVGTFPSAVTSPMSGVRFFLGYFPPVLSAAALLLQIWQDESPRDVSLGDEPPGEKSPREETPGITHLVIAALLFFAYVQLWLVLPELARLLGTAN